VRRQDEWILLCLILMLVRTEARGCLEMGGVYWIPFSIIKLVRYVVIP
jgi:hypothetical protein